MLPPTLAGAVTAAHQSDVRKRAEQARYLEYARIQAAEHTKPFVPPAHRRLRWWRRPVIRPA